MKEARGLRDVSPKAGTFVLVALLIAAIGIYLAGRAQGWFEPTLHVKATPVTLALDSSLGLQNGAEVQILGATAGTVRDVQVQEEKTQSGSVLQLRFGMDVRGPMLPLVRRDSKIVIKRKFGLAGSAFVQIMPGQAEPATANDTLPCSIPPDLMSTTEDTLRSTEKILSNVQLLTANLLQGKGAAGKILSDDATATQIQQTLNNLQQLSSDLTHGKGAAGKVLSDPATGQQLADSLSALSQTLKNVDKMVGRAESADFSSYAQEMHQTLAKTGSALDEVTKTTANLREQTAALPALLSETQEMMRQTTRLMEAMQRSWLLRDYVTPEGSSRLSPIEVTSP